MEMSAMHVEKVKLSASKGGLLEHDYRFEGDGIDHQKVKHPERTKDNRYVGYTTNGEIGTGAADAANSGKFKGRVRNAVSDAAEMHQKTAGRKPKSNAVGLVSIVVTLPFDWPSDVSPWVFFEAAYRSIEEYYEMSGVESQRIPAAVHMDETTPHMHHLMVPLLNGRLDANSVLNRAFYKRLHPFVQERVKEITGVECSVLLDEEDAMRRALSHVPQEDLDAVREALTRQAREESASMLAEAEEMRSEARRAVSRAAKREERSNARKSALDAREDALDARERALDEREAALSDAEKSRYMTRIATPYAADEPLTHPGHALEL